jgi:hypothetical protein
MSSNGNEMNVRFLVDVPPPTFFVSHSSELKIAYYNQLRTEFLNFKGQDYFTLECNITEQETWEAAWRDQADIRYAIEGDYRIDAITGEETLIDLNVIAPVRTCDRYSWDLTGLAGETLVTLVYNDCNCEVQTVEDIVSNLANPYVFCSFDLPTVTAGVLTYVEPCTEIPY